MDVMPGYKQTEAGVIPIDWLERSIGELHPYVTSGSRGWAAYYSVNGDPFIRITNLIRSSIYLCLDDLRFVKIPAGDSEGARTQLQNGDVLISITADIGIIGFVSEAIPKPSYINQHIALIRFDLSSVCSQFVSYFLASEGPQRIFRALTNSGAKAGMNLSTVQQVRLSLPPTIVEQEAIVTALSDADALIESLEHLLNKKRQIKKGAMQELLTGKKRLPGFTGKWETKRLGDVADTDPENFGSETKPMFSFNYISLEDVDTGILRDHSEEIFQSAPSRARRKLRKNDVLVSTVRPNLQSHFLFPFEDDNWVCSTGFCVVRCRSALTEPRYVYFHMFSEVVARQIEALLSGSNYPAINSADVRALHIPLPAYKEQVAIADILSDMDSEITALEAKLVKACQLKQSMMQELLTGRIRLVRPSAQVLSFPVKENAVVDNVSHNTHFSEAVVIAMLSAKFGSETFPLGRFRRTKFSYLLHRHVEHEAAGFMKKAAGPYNPRTRYGGAEKIALQNRYVRTLSTAKGEGFVADENIDQAEGYFDKWYGAEALTWLEQFRYQKNDALELLTTVDMASEDLSRAGKVVTTSTVKQIIHDSPEWKAKLDRSVFSDDNIAASIQTCRQLFSG